MIQARGDIAVGRPMVERISPVSQSGPPFGGQIPFATESARTAARTSRLAKGQMWVKRGGPSSAYMAIDNGESSHLAGTATSQAAMV
jgi:hypothetical protein